MPPVIVNIFSIVAGVVIQWLSTLELTVQRHFCSILKHENSDASSTNDGFRAVELTLRRLPNFATANPSCGAVIPCLAYLRTRRYQPLRFLSVRVTTTTYRQVITTHAITIA